MPKRQDRETDARPARQKALRGLPILVLALSAIAWGGAQACDNSPEAATPSTAPVSSPDSPPVADAPVTFDEERLWSDLERIVGFGNRVSGSAENAALRGFLMAELKRAGLEPVEEGFESQTPAGPIAFANVYADLRGAERDGGPTPMVILGTHFDTKRLDAEFQGANDGGSGTAVLLALARQLAGESSRRPVTYRFLFIDGEEAVNELWRDPDNRYGSRYHARMLHETDRAREVGAFVLLDMVGDPDLEFFDDSYSEVDLKRIFRNAARGIGLGRHFGTRREPVKDDHLSFLEIDIPSIDLIDLSFGPNNAYWHTTHDRLENCSAESLRITADIVWAALPGVEGYALAQRR